MARVDERTTVVGDVAQVLGMGLMSNLSDDRIRRLVEEMVPDLAEWRMSLGSLTDVGRVGGENGRRVTGTVTLGPGHGKVEFDLRWTW